VTDNAKASPWPNNAAAYRGRKPALNQEQIAQLIERAAAGTAKAVLARDFGISRERCTSICGQQRGKGRGVREHAAALTTARAAATDLAVTLATVRAALGGVQGRAAGNMLEMAELDALSARDAIEKAIWEMDLTPSADPGREVPTGPVSAPRRAVASVPLQPSVVVLSPRLVRRSRRPVIVVGQGELF